MPRSDLPRRLIVAVQISAVIIALFSSLSMTTFTKDANGADRSYIVAAGTDDGYVYGRSSVYNTARTVAYSSNVGGNSIRLGQLHVGTYSVCRGFARLDTTALGNDVIIYNATLSFYVSATYLTGSNFTLQLRQWITDVPIGNEDYSQYGATVYGKFNTSDITGNGWYAISLYDTNIIEKANYTYVSLVSDRDATGSPPGAYTNEYFEFLSRDNGLNCLSLNVSYMPRNGTESLSLRSALNATKPSLQYSAGQGIVFEGTPGWQERTFPTVRGRWVKFDQIMIEDLGRFAHLIDTQFYDADSSVYRNFSVVYNSCGGIGQQYFIDGNFSTMWMHDTNEGHWIMLDCGQPYNISKIRVYITVDLKTWIASCDLYVCNWHDWKESGNAPYIDGNNDSAYIYTNKPGNTSGAFDFTDIVGYEGRWIENVTFGIRLRLTNTTGSILMQYQYQGAYYDYRILTDTTEWFLAYVAPYKFWNTTNINDLEIRFVSEGPGSFYVDYVNATVYSWTLIERLTYYCTAGDSVLNWTEQTYYGLVFGTTTPTQMGDYIDTLASKQNWHDVLIWSARCKKLGIERPTAIRDALNNLTKSGELPKSSQDGYGNYYYSYDRDLLYATFYYGERYGVERWNKTAAYNFMRNARVANCTPGRNSILVYYDGKCGSSSYGRFYDENAQAIGDYLTFYELGVAEALDEALYLWNQVNVVHWNETNPYGLHYNYGQNVYDYECEGAFFLRMTALLYWIENTCGNQTRIVIDLQNRFLNRTWQSPQWSSWHMEAFCALHSGLGFEIEGGTAERRVQNNLGSWMTLAELYDVLNSTMQNNINLMINGTTKYAPAWKLQYHHNTQCYNPNTSRFVETSAYWGTPGSSIATAQELCIQFILGMMPINATMAFPLEEMHYEYGYDIDPTMFSISVSSRILRVSIWNPGSIQFWYGNTPVVFNFPAEGIYELTFDEDWTQITNGVKVGDLSYDKKYFANIMVLSSKSGVDGPMYVGESSTFRSFWQSRGYTQTNVSTALFYWNASGSMQLNGTMSLTGTASWSNFTRRLPNATMAISWYILVNETTNGRWTRTPTITTVTQTRPSPVGGVYVPVDKLRLKSPSFLLLYYSLSAFAVTLILLVASGSEKKHCRQRTRRLARCRGVKHN